MTMTQALYEIAPNTTRMFASWLMEGYGLSLVEFDKATIKRKYYEVCKYFGYPLEENTSLPTDEIILFVKKTFADYENIMRKYPDGVPNPLHIIKEMSHEEKDKWLAKHFVRVINISLRHALIEGNGLKRVSLRDSLIERKLSIKEVAAKHIAENKAIVDRFWQDTIKNFNAQEIAPF